MNFGHIEEVEFFVYMQLDFDSGAPPEHAWRRKLNSHAGILKEFSVTFMEAMKMVVFITLN